MRAVLAIEPGDVFGQWTVLSRSGSSPHKKAVWLCRCSCGTERTVLGVHLAGRKSTKCGRCGPFNRGLIDETGKRYGLLSVVCRVGSGKLVKWKCVCACGAESNVRSSDLRNGRVLSCGKCWNSGSRHYRWNPQLTALDRNKHRGSKHQKWSKAVIGRDGQCVRCKKAECRLNAHHIELFRTAKDKRYDVDNGRTLCVKCHASYHRMYKDSMVGMDTLEEFIQDNAPCQY